VTFKTKCPHANSAQRIYPARGKSPYSLHLSLKEHGRRLVQISVNTKELKQFLVVVDYYLRFPEIAYMSSTTSDHVINKLKDFFEKGKTAY